ncbi:MAG: hypothetical protein RBU21_08885, partial [FCB group bacterium]|nr:hypothetical protein [FCB group bacterium]
IPICCYTYLGWAASEDEHFAAIVASLFLKDEIDPKNNPQTADNDLNLEDFGGALALHARFNAVVGAQLAAAGISLPALKGNGDGFVYSDGSSIYRMKKGLERFVITNVGDTASGIAQSCLMVMWDRVSDKPEGFSHVPAGCNVLFLDGHVEFRKSPWHYPVTKVSAVLSRLID